MNGRRGLGNGQDHPLHMRVTARLTEPVLDLGIGEVELQQKGGDKDQHPNGQGKRTLEKHKEENSIRREDDLQLLPR